MYPTIRFTATYATAYATPACREEDVLESLSLGRGMTRARAEIQLRRTYCAPSLEGQCEQQRQDLSRLQRMA